jgi:hypothetical protein
VREYSAEAQLQQCMAFDKSANAHTCRLYIPINADLTTEKAYIHIKGPLVRDFIQFDFDEPCQSERDE